MLTQSHNNTKRLGIVPHIGAVLLMVEIVVDHYGAVCMVNSRIFQPGM